MKFDVKKILIILHGSIGRICMQSIDVEEIRANLDIVLSRPGSKVVSRVN